MRFPYYTLIISRNVVTCHKTSKPERSTDSELLVEYEMYMAIFVEDIKEYVKKRNILKESIQRLYFIIWEQCSKTTRANPGGTKGFNKIEEEKDSITLLREIKSVAYYRNP